MAALVVAAAGAAIGSSFGYASIGWSVGSVIGSLLFPTKTPDIQGPRLEDLKVQTSTYGTFIPITYGAYRLSGNVIYATDIVETENEEEAGKGGGGGSYTTYTYSVSCAIAVCKGPVSGIRRIWANGKLIYDSRGATLITGDYSAINIYLGSESQIPDPFWEGYHGAGKVPAHRGLCYVSIENMQLADYGNRVPNFTFEVDSIVNSVEILEAETSGRIWGYNPDLNEVLTFANVNIGLRDKIIRLNPSTGEILGQIDTDGFLTNRCTYNPIKKQLYFYATRPFTEPTEFVVVLDSLTNEIITNASDWQNGESIGYVTVDTDNGDVYQLSYGYTLRVLNPDDFTIDSTHDISIEFDVVHQDIIYGNNSIWVIARQELLDGYKVILIEVDKTTFDVIDFYDIDENVEFEGVAYDSFNKFLWINTRDYIYCFNTETKELNEGIIIGINPIIEGTDTFDAIDGYTIAYDPINNHIWTWGLGNDYNQYALAYETSTRERCACLKITNYEGSPLFDSTEGVSITNNGHAIYNDSGYPGNFVNVYAECGGGLKISNIITDMCSQVNIPAELLNFDRLNDESVIGYGIGKSLSARSAIEPLQAAYYFDVVESDNKLAFITRGGDIAVSIPDYYLGASTDGNQIPVEIITTMESELPSKITVVYPNYAQDYEANAQNTIRISGNSLNQSTLELPIVLNDEKAKEVANVNLFSAWISKRSFKFSTTRQYAYLEPTDIVQISNNGFSHIVRIVNKSESTNGIINFEAVSEKANVYQQTGDGAGSADGFVEQTVKGLPITYLQLMDIPALRDDDVNAGFYYSACGEFESATVKKWRGATVFKSVDNGTSYSSWATVTTPTVIGTCDNILGDFISGNIFDEINYLYVTILGGGELVSESEINVLNGANVAIIGNEIIQFKYAELIDTNQYKLSGLLRGRKGTENYISNHQSNERFVLVNKNSWERTQISGGDLQLQRNYVGVTSSGYLSDYIDNNIVFTNTGNAIKPYSVSNIGGGRNADGDVIIKWIRRNNKNNEWLDLIDVPMTEQTEGYIINIYNSDYTELKRTINSSVENCIYTSEQQIDDFGTLQSLVYVKISQISANIGFGIEQKGTI